METKIVYVTIEQQVLTLPEFCYIGHYQFDKDAIKLMIDSLLAQDKEIQAIKLIRALNHYDKEQITKSLKQAKDYIYQYKETGVFY